MDTTRTCILKLTFCPISTLYILNECVSSCLQIHTLFVRPPVRIQTMLLHLVRVYKIKQSHILFKLHPFDLDDVAIFMHLLINGEKGKSLAIFLQVKALNQIIRTHCGPLRSTLYDISDLGTRLLNSPYVLDVYMLSGAI